MPGTTTRLGLPFSQGTDLASTIDDTMEALAEAVAAGVLVYDEGTLDSRPSAGTVGRVYRATDTNQLDWDTGSTWVHILPAAGSIGNAHLAPETITNSRISPTAGIQGTKLADATVGPEKLTAALKPSGSADAATEALRALGTTASKAAAGNDARFPAGADIVETDVADGAVSSRKLKPTVGTKAASADLALGTSYADIALTGGDLSITPAVASLLKVTAVFNFRLIGTVSTEGYMEARGTINLDGADQTAEAYALHLSDSPASSADTLNVTVTQVYLLSLTAAAHTIKMRGRRGSSVLGGASALSPMTRMLYELVAA